MKKWIFAFLLVAGLFSSRGLFAKGPTLKVVISGRSLSTPIIIDDRKTLANFNIWSGPGTSPRHDEGFIVDWSTSGVVPPRDLKQYQVSFYANHHPDGPDYVMTYVYDPVGRKGYVYLPGRGEPEYERNTFSIYRQVEGHWFLAIKAWDNLVEPLIKNAANSPG
jgi:hypothetical protein